MYRVTGGDWVVWKRVCDGWYRIVNTFNYKISKHKPCETIPDKLALCCMASHVQGGGPGYLPTVDDPGPLPTCSYQATAKALTQGKC